jgi:pimeloyl-ACP methyl ester carboxylesterase
LPDVAQQPKAAASAQRPSLPPGLSKSPYTFDSHFDLGDPMRKLLLALRALLLSTSLGWLLPAAASPYPVFQTDCSSMIPAALETLITGGRANPRLSCWVIALPENYSQPTGRQVWVSFYQLATATPPARPDPIYYLPGGPGGSGYFSLSFFTRSNLGPAGNESLQGRRNMVLIDPRGNLPLQTTVANPESECPEAYAAIFDVLGSTARTTAQEYARWAQGTRECMNRLRASGWDLNQYNTRNIVRDVEEIRIALGHPQINLYSESYGTLHALHYMRTYGSRVRASVLDSVTSFTRPYDPSPALAQPAGDSLNKLLAACEADTRCNTNFPAFRSQLLSVLFQLDATPYVTQVPNDYTGVNNTVQFTGQRLLGLLVGALYRPDLFSLIPGAVKAIAENNNFALIEQFKSKVQSYADGGFGMKAATICVDFGRIGTMTAAAEVESLSPLYRHYAMVANVACDAVNVAAAPVGFNTPVSSNVISLVIAGKWDPITPWADSRDAANLLSRSRLAVFEHQSHVPVRRNACAQHIAMRFFEGGLLTSTACVAADPAPIFR